ncbi:MAG: 1-acyl-sn-glycerol-3-phosphate acyltransferase [Alistipes sp.]|nr:1-acyl-sn-glycerol-3-phosphate acyltransferase [Alistipes sp.]
MAKQKRVQDNDIVYNALRRYVDLVLKLSYRNIKYVGLERIPKDGAVIFAPNHTGALMDALVILAMDKRPKVFVARADMFKNPKLAKFLTFCKIMPIMRMRDGIDEVKKNNETIERAVEVLRDRVPFCIFPEGTHQTKYSTLPLAKGIFRIALQAHELMPNTPLYIIPVGIRYGSFFRFRSSARVQIGEPINIGEFIAEHPDMTPQEQMNDMRTCLEKRMQESIFYIPNDEDYDATYEICAAVVKKQVNHLRNDEEYGNLRGIDAHFAANNMTVKHLDYLKKVNPELASRLITLGNEASKLRKDDHISLNSVSVKYPLLSRILKVLFMLVTLPYTLVATVCTLPIKIACHFIFKLFKDQAFRNSVRYVLHLVLWPLLMVVYGLLSFVYLPTLWAVVATVALIPAPIVTHEVYRLFRIMISDIKLWRNKSLREKYREIRDIMFQ